MKMMECFEAYGLERGKRECADLISDFQECVGMQKQLLRFHVSLSMSINDFHRLFMILNALLGHAK